MEDTKVPNEIWKKGDRFIDPFRPIVEPDGFTSPDEVKHTLIQTISSFRESIEVADYFVFTLGLTESWRNQEGQYEYPMYPGTVAGNYKPDEHQFVNLHYNEIISSLVETVRMMRSVNSNLKFIFTVSPVPLTATYSGKHVVVATMASKSILRAVASQLSDTRNFIDYFPSCLLYTSPSPRDATLSRMPSSA